MGIFSTILSLPGFLPFLGMIAGFAGFILIKNMGLKRISLFIYVLSLLAVFILFADALLNQKDWTQELFRASINLILALIVGIYTLVSVRKNKEFFNEQQATLAFVVLSSMLGMSLFTGVIFGILPMWVSFPTTIITVAYIYFTWP